jgi:hypothetical protein
MGGSPDDYSGDVSKQITNMSGLGDKLKGLGDDSKSALDQLVAQYTPMFQQQINASAANQANYGDRSDSEWNAYVRSFRPAAEKFAANAMSYDTPERREQVAGDAMANTRTAFDQAGRQLDAGLSSAMVDPNSGAAIAQRRQLAAQGAAAVAASGNAARREVEDTGMQYLNQSAGLGQAVAGNSMALGDRSVQAGNSAIQQAGQLQAFTTAPQTTAAGLYSAAGQTYGNAGNLTLGLQSAATDAWQAKDSSTKDWVIGGASLGASAYSGGKK